MPADGTETILTIAASWISSVLNKRSPAPSKGFLPIPQSEAGSLLANLLWQGVYRLRTAELEKNETIRQVIPYVLLSRGPKWLWYRRPAKNGETRLQGRKSLGWGGHVRFEDQMSSMLPISPGRNNQYVGSTNASLMTAIETAALRELEEETNLSGGMISPLTFRGLIHDDSDAVGRVHLGLVFTAEVSAGHEPITDSEEIETFGWEEVTSLWGSVGREGVAGWEEWSRLLLPSIAAYSSGISGGAACS